MAEDWDLQAVVRGCATTTSCCSTTTTTTTSASCQTHQDGEFLWIQDLLFEPRNEITISTTTNTSIQELRDLYKPFFLKSSQPLSPQQQSNIPISPLSVLGGLQDLSHPQQQQIYHQPKQTTTLSIVRGGSRNGGSSHNPSPRSKRRKNQMKRVCQVPAEALSSDMWSWRKYGQKPIKGSPYPRGYYRCSTSKGCLARKQVERNRSDPGMFIVTYTAEHNHPMPTHRNSLAGSTRQKSSGNPQAGNSEDPSKSANSSPVSPVPEKFEMESSKEEMMEDEDDDINAPEMPLDDDFFDGLDELAEKSAGNLFPDHFPRSLQLPWLANNATTTAGGGS